MGTPLKNIRDLLVGPPHPIEANTLQMVAHETVEERTAVPDPTAGFTARLPGLVQEEHPLDTGINPFEGENVLFVARALREGQIPPHLERQARSFIDRFQKMTGEVVYDPRMHIPSCPVEQQYSDENTISPANGLRRADPYPYGKK